MPSPTFLPPTVAPEQLLSHLRQQGFAVMGAGSVAQWLGPTVARGLHDLGAFWNDLPADQYLKDGGRYRRRRHGSFVLNGQDVQAVPHRAHWQPLSYNALHGGMERWFDPLQPELANHPSLQGLLLALGQCVSDLRGAQTWHVEVHAFRIDTTDGIGRPTPEGAHRDGVDVVAVFMLGRHQIKGGESRVFDAQGPSGQRFTLTEPWSLLLVDDQRVIHETTPIQPVDPDREGWRDTLVVTLRADGFLEEKKA